jgi:hypothetical protein
MYGYFCDRIIAHVHVPLSSEVLRLTVVGHYK